MIGTLDWYLDCKFTTEEYCSARASSTLGYRSVAYAQQTHWLPKPLIMLWVWKKDNKKKLRVPFDCLRGRGWDHCTSQPFLYSSKLCFFLKKIFPRNFFSSYSTMQHLYCFLSLFDCGPLKWTRVFLCLHQRLWSTQS